MTIDKSFEDRLGEVLSAPMSPQQRTELDRRVESALAATPFPVRRRRAPVRRSVLLAAALVLLLPTIFVVGAALNTEDPFGLTDAPGFQAELDAAMAQVPLPAGRAWPDYLRADPSAAYSRGGGQSWVELNAVCIWFDEWLGARAASDADRERIAAATIADIPTWPSWSSPFWTESVRDHLVPLIAAIDHGDATPIRREMQLNCSGIGGD